MYPCHYSCGSGFSPAVWTEGKYLHHSLTVSIFLGRPPTSHQTMLRGAVGKPTVAKSFCTLGGSIQRRVWKRSSKVGGASKMAKARNWRLVIVGAGRKRYEGQLRRLMAKSDQSDRIDFFPPMFNKLRDVAFNASDAFVLPSFADGNSRGLGQRIACRHDAAM
jgi:glycosyltransferase involved in cell wall biosynthesis